MKTKRTIGKIGAITIKVVCSAGTNDVGLELEHRRGQSRAAYQFPNREAVQEFLREGNIVTLDKLRLPTHVGEFLRLFDLLRVWSAIPRPFQPRTDGE